MKEKLEEANKILKEIIKDTFTKKSYPYIDFVKEDRFLSEILNDREVNIEALNSEELADYAFEQISRGASLSNLFGF